MKPTEHMVLPLPVGAGKTKNLLSIANLDDRKGEEGQTICYYKTVALETGPSNPGGFSSYSQSLRSKFPTCTCGLLVAPQCAAAHWLKTPELRTLPLPSPQSTPSPGPQNHQQCNEIGGSLLKSRAHTRERRPFYRDSTTWLHDRVSPC